MLAALLCNLEEPRGPILRERGSASVGKDVLKAAGEIQDILFPLPAKTKVKVKRAVQKVYEYSELPTVDMKSLGGALEETQIAIADVQSLLADLNEPQWAIELRVLLQRLTLIAWQLNDDEEALLLLM
jgi:hypothetical protein